MRNTVRISILCMIILGLALSSTNVRGQVDPLLAPGVLSSFPAQREVIGPDAQIQIVFNQPMNKASVEAALLVDPRIEGTLRWAEDSTLTFDPAGPLVRGREYLISIAPEAMTATGVQLGERFKLNFSVAPNLSVQQVIPAPDTKDIDARAAVTVIFDRPVVPLVTTGDQSGLPQPLTFEPAIDGTGSWIGTAIYTFRPNKAWAGSTTYTAVVRGDLTDVDGSPMTGTYSWTFSTGAPRLLYTYPNADQSLVYPDSTIQLTFNQPMDVSSTRGAFTVRNAANGADVAGTIIFSEDGTTLTFTPAAKLALNTTYLVEITAAARSASGEAGLVNPQAYRFTTPPYPAVVQTNPSNGSMIQPGGGVFIEYNTEMDPKSFVGKVHISPEPKKIDIYGGRYTQINFQSQPATTYTVTIDPGVMDIFGNVLDQALTFTFSTTDAPAEIAIGMRDVINVTSAYRSETAIPAAAINVSQIIMNVSALEFNELLSLPWSGGYVNLYDYQPPRVTRSLSFPISVDRNVRAEMKLPISGEAGTKAAPGAYFLEIGAPEVMFRTGRYSARTILLVTTANLTMKVMPGQVFVWAVDLKTGQPLTNVDVQLFDEYGRVKIASAQTDVNGVVRFPISKQNEMLYSGYLAAINTGDAFALTSSRWTNELEPYESGIGLDVPVKERVYLYTDQPIYRPGRPVYFRGVARIQDDVTFSAPPYSQLRAIITDPAGQEVYNQTVTLNPYGGFSGQFDLPQNVTLGQYYLRVEHTDSQPSYPFDNTLYFQVAEYRPPEFLTTMTADKQEYAAGDMINVTVDGKFLFGGAVSGGAVSWVAIANQGYFNYTGAGSYDFGQYGWYYWDRGYTYNREVARGTGTLDANGQLHIEIPADLGDSSSTQNFTIEATVTDVSNQAISGRTNVTVHPAEFYIGLAPKVYVGKAGQPLEVNLIAVNWESAPLADQKLTLTATRRSWVQNPTTLEWEQDSTVVAEQDISTDSSGKAVFTFTPPDAGIYEIEATGRDPRERIARTTTTVWVQGSSSVSWSRDDKRLTLIADAKTYQPGDTAGVLITSPFPEEVTALVTVERAGVMKSEVVKFTGSYTYQLPLEEIHAPNVYVAVALFRSSGEEGRVNELRYGLINLPVEVQKRLNVKITPSTLRSEPGKTVQFNIQVSDLSGNPVSAEVGLSLSDVATLSVGAPNSTPIFDFFWSPRQLSVVTSAAMFRVIDAIKAADLYLNQFDTRREEMEFAAQATQSGQLADGIAAPAPSADAANEAGGDKLPDTGGGGGAQQEAVTPRTNFVDTPLWLPGLVTNADGKATADVVLPDNLTTWRLDVRAITADTAVGDATIEIVSTKPLLVRPATPRFFVVGDEPELAMVVNNNTDRALDVTMTLEAKGVTLRAGAAQQITIEANGRARVAWLATVGDVDAVDLIFTAVSGEFSDASKPQVGLGADRLLPVYKYRTPDYVSTAGVLFQPGARSEAIQLPAEELAPTGDLTITLNPSLAAATIDALKYLENFEYQCLEQTVSKFLPNVVTFRALQKLGLAKPQLRADLEAAVSYALARLKREQHGDGGWGWFYSEQSSPLTTAYALLGLLEAKASDFPVEQSMIDRAAGFLLTQVITPTDRTETYVLNRQVFIAFVLAKVQRWNTDVLNSLFTLRDKLQLSSRAFLAQALAQSGGDRSKIDTLLSDLNSAAILSATGAHWEESTRDWWNWGSNTRTTAIVLETLVKLSPTDVSESPLIPNVVRWLMVARRGDAWETTQETAWAVMALTNWMDATGELNADYDFSVALNGEQIGQGTASGGTLTDTTVLTADVAKMLRDTANRVTVDHGAGSGSLYYTMALHVEQPVEAVKPTNRGLQFKRTYKIGDQIVTSAPVGQTITVELEIVAEHDLYYVNINDPIPAGTEIIDRSLQTTSQVGAPTDFYAIDLRYGWGWWWFSNTEARTEKMVWSATYLPRGTYRFVYQVLATTPGTYRVIPPNGQEFYFPEVFGRGAGSLFTVIGE